MNVELKPYPEYKDSGVPWLGQVPVEWEVRRLRNVVEMRVSNVDKHAKDDEFPVRLCNYIDVYKNDRITERIPFMMATAKPEEIERFRLEAGDVLITKDSEAWNDIGVPALVSFGASDLLCGYHLALLRPLQDYLGGEYLFCALQSPNLAHQFHVAANGVTRYGLSHNAIKSVVLPIPPLAEQAAIVRFLDHYDRKIRRFIRAKQKLIKLLEEQKQAIIHRAVTRGLDPNVRLKPSGVECLGDVPGHWTVHRLRNLTEMRVSNVDKHTKQGEEAVRLCNYLDVYKNDYIHANLNFMRATATQDEIARFRLTAGDVLITKDSEAWNDIGVPALVIESTEDLLSGYHLALLRPFDETICGAYLFRALQSRGAQYQFHVEANGVTRYGLAHAAIKSVCLPVPPRPEQDRIVRLLDATTVALAEGIRQAQREIDLLREYHTRLLADVVTGKLDVREAATNLPDEPKEPEPIGEAGPVADNDDDLEDEPGAVPEEAQE